MSRTRIAMYRSFPGFTLIELLVVIAIISLLLAVLLPTLSGARSQGQSVKCKSGLQQVGVGLVMYADANDGYVVPSYNLATPGSGSNTTGGPSKPFDGWAPILDRDRLVDLHERDTRTIFYCPSTVNVEGMKDGQTGTNPDKPRGWTDWPLVFSSAGGDSSPKMATTIPEQGYNKIIRVSYWLNAYNPVGNSVPDLSLTDLHYTASVGFGPDEQGKYIEPHKMINTLPSLFIVVADGIYMGRQQVTRLGDPNSRIGYRHPGMGRREGATNTAFADGHVEMIAGDRFPRAVTTADTADLIAEKRAENLRGPTVYADPRKVFQ